MGLIGPREIHLKTGWAFIAPINIGFNYWYTYFMSTASWIIYTILNDLVCFAALSAHLFLREVSSAVLAWSDIRCSCVRLHQLREALNTVNVPTSVAVNCNIGKAELLITWSARPADLSWHMVSRQGRRYHAYRNVRLVNYNHWLRVHSLTTTTLHYTLDELYGGTLSSNDSLITSSLVSHKWCQVQFLDMLIAEPWTFYAAPVSTTLK